MQGNSSQRLDKKNKYGFMNRSVQKFTDNYRKQKCHHEGQSQKTQLNIKSISSSKKSFSQSFFPSRDLSKNSAPLASKASKESERSYHYKFKRKIRKQKRKVQIQIEELRRLQKNMVDIIGQIKKTLQTLQNYVVNQLPKCLNFMIGEIKIKVNEVSRNNCKLTPRSQTTQETQKQFSGYIMKLQNDPNEIIQNYIESIKLVTGRLMGKNYELQRGFMKDDQDLQDYENELNLNIDPKANKVSRINKLKASMSLNDEMQ